MKFVTYLTIYTGDKLPPFYIGSTTYKKFKNFYHGSVLSQKYKKIYNKELKEHPENFDSCIIDEFNSRKEALECELYYQKLFDVVKSDLFFNMSFAAPNGFFGREIKKQDHPLYGSHNGKGNIHSHNPKTLEQFFLPYIPEGCVSGRGPNYNASSHNKGKKWYNNGINQKLMFDSDITEGWVKGKLPGSASKASRKMWKRKRNENSIHG